MISDYLRAERMDFTEPASFYVPGMQDWNELRRTVRLTRGERQDPEEVEQDDGTSEHLH